MSNLKPNIPEHLNPSSPKPNEVIREMSGTSMFPTTQLPMEILALQHAKQIKSYERKSRRHTKKFDRRRKKQSQK